LETFILVVTVTFISGGQDCAVAAFDTLGDYFKYSAHIFYILEKWVRTVTISVDVAMQFADDILAPTFCGRILVFALLYLS